MLYFKKLKTCIQWVMLLLCMEVFLLLPVFQPAAFTAHAAEQTTIIMLDPNRDYQVGEKVKVTVRVSSTDGSLLKSADCGFGYNGATMELLTELTEENNHFLIQSDTPQKWLSYDLEFEMKCDGPMFFIAGAYSGDGVIQGFRSDGSRMSLPRASVVRKIGTGIYSKVSDCDLEELSMKDNEGQVIAMDRDFDKNVTEYWVTVESDVDTLTVETAAVNKDDNVILPEDLNIPPGESEKTITVEASDGMQKQYILHINRKIEEVCFDDIILKDQDGTEIPYTYQKQQTEYDITVPSNVIKLTMEGVSSNPKITGKMLSEEEIQTTYSIKKIQAESDMGKKVYTFNITRETSPLSLTTIDLIGSDELGVKLEPEFSPEVTEYRAQVTSDVQNVFIHVETANPTDQVSGFEENKKNELQEGDNLFEIKVTDGVQENIYSLHVERAVGDRQEAEVVTPEKRFNYSAFTTFAKKNYIYLIIIAVVCGAAIFGVSFWNTLKEVREYDQSDEAMAKKDEEERKARIAKAEEQRKQELKKKMKEQQSNKPKHG